MRRDEADRDAALNAMADEIRARLSTPREDYVDKDTVFAAVRAALLEPPRGRT